ncbi:PIN domain-containing protein, partial [Vibrio parahaemolyticus]|nr:PIN domain-containing protein [Vibrio parahaemolyticus]
MGDTDRKLFVLDTNILLHEPLAIYSFKEHDVVIPMTVLEELDRIKDSKRDVARDARVAIRALEHLFHDATPEEITEGIPLSKQEGATGTISILADYELDETVKAFTDKEGDNRILNAVLYLQAQRTPRAVVLVTKDINMRLRAKGAGVLYVEDYRTDQLIDDIQYLTKGFQTRPGSFWDSVDDVASYTLGGKTFHKLDRAPFDPTFLNQYVIDEDSDFAARVETIDGDTLTLRDLSRERMMHRKAWGITPKNIYQGMALDALLDPDIDLVILTGAAGSGKTLVGMAAAVGQTVERKKFG